MTRIAMMHFSKNGPLVAVHGGALVIERAELTENKKQTAKVCFFVLSITLYVNVIRCRIG